MGLSVRKGWIFGAVAAVAFSGGVQRYALAGEPLDNSVLIKALEAGIDPRVLDNKIDSYDKKGSATPSEKGVSEIHFDASIDELVKIKAAAEKGGWSKDDIAKLQNRVITIANSDKKRMTELVSRALNVFDNEDPTEYDIIMRELKKEGKAITPFILQQIEQESERKRKGALDALGQIGDKSPAVIDKAIFMLTDHAKPVRLEAARCVARLADAKTCDDLIARLAVRDVMLDGVCMALGYLGDPKAEEALVQTLKYAYDSDTRVCAAFALGKLRAKSEAARSEMLAAVLDDHDPALREAAANALAMVGDKRTPSFIKKAFERFRPGREEIVRHLASFKCVESVEFLLEQLDNDAPKIKRAAQETLVLLTGENQTSVEEWKSWWETVRTNPNWIQVDTGSKVPEPGSAAKKPDSDSR